jgi:hypothetical protein
MKQNDVLKIPLCQCCRAGAALYWWMEPDVQYCKHNNNDAIADTVFQFVFNILACFACRSRIRILPRALPA